MKKKLNKLIFLLSSFVLTVFFPFSALAEETISGSVIQNEWEYELKDNVMTWKFLSDNSDVIMVIKDGVCSIDGNIISINIFSDSWNEPITNDDSQFVFDWMNNNPIHEIKFSDNITQIDSMLFSTGYFNNATNIHLGKNIQIIGDYSFSGSSIKELIIPENLQTIGNNAFIGCANLCNATILSKSVSLEYSGIGYIDFNKYLDNVIIHGYSNSTAESYAKENEFTFISLDKTQLSGDANNDGELTVSDAAFIARTLARRETIDVTTNPAADYNNDGKVTVSDAATIARDLAKK